MRKLKGLHHVTAITSSAEKIYQFFTNVLGLRLVKKTINQDDINVYHLFFADDKGSPGTDVTFFDFQGIGKMQRGTNEISRIGLRVKDDQSLTYWVKRFKKYNIKNDGIVDLFDRKMLYFYDFDDQAYALVSDENIQGVEAGLPWHKGPVPDEFAITGLGPIFICLSNVETMGQQLVHVLGMRYVKNESTFTLYEMGEGGNGASIILELEKRPIKAVQGYGAVHHVAFRIEDLNELNEWIDLLNKSHIYHSGYVDRFYFKSLYTRLYPNILFEFATEGPGFMDDEEDYLTLGETLALPPKFRNQRAYVESVVRPIETTRSNKIFEKEYFYE